MRVYGPAHSFFGVKMSVDSLNFTRSSLFVFYSFVLLVDFGFVAPFHNFVIVFFFIRFSFVLLLLLKLPCLETFYSFFSAKIFYRYFHLSMIRLVSDMLAFVFVCVYMEENKIMTVILSMPIRFYSQNILDAFFLLLL